MSFPSRNKGISALSIQNIMCPFLTLIVFGYNIRERKKEKERERKKNRERLYLLQQVDLRCALQTQLLFYTRLVDRQSEA